MDKKELQNLIDRISLTGPEGIKKIKKVLKELSDGSSSGSMGEDEEYTIAQALNDLNERVATLESVPAPKSEIKPIVLSDFPLTTMETQAELDAIGLTYEEIVAAAQGKRTGVVIGNNFYSITKVSKFSTQGNYFIAFYSSFFNEEGEFDTIYGFTIDCSGGTVTVVQTDN